MKKFFKWLKSLDKRIKFLLVGCLNTAVGIIAENVAFLIMGVPFSFSLHMGAGLNIPVWQTAIATVANYLFGSINSFFWNKFFTFESEEKSPAEAVRFFVVCVLQAGLHFGLQTLCTNVIGIGTTLATIITTLITLVFSYVGHNFFSFKKQKPQGKQAEEQNQTEEK